MSDELDDNAGAYLEDVKKKALGEDERKILIDGNKIMKAATVKKTAVIEVKDAMVKVSDENLRDQFAMAALTGLLNRGPGDGVVYAYKIADAMLKEREKYICE